MKSQNKCTAKCIDRTLVNSKKKNVFKNALVTEGRIFPMLREKLNRVN